MQADNRNNANREAPGNKLSVEERQAIVDVCNSDRFKSLPPSQIVPVLADEGEYLGSERTFYRVLHERGQQHHRGRAAKVGNRQAIVVLCNWTEPGLVLGYHIFALTSGWTVLLSVSGDRHIQPYDCDLGNP